MALMGWILKAWAFLVSQKSAFLKIRCWLINRVGLPPPCLYNLSKAIQVKCSRWEDVGSNPRRVILKTGKIVPIASQSTQCLGLEMGG